MNKNLYQTLTDKYYAEALEKKAKDTLSLDVNSSDIKSSDKVEDALSDAMSDTYLYAKSSQRAEDEIYIKFWEFMIGKSESDYRLFSENKFIYIVLNDKDLLEWNILSDSFNTFNLWIDGDFIFKINSESEIDNTVKRDRDYIAIRDYVRYLYKKI